MLVDMNKRILIFLILIGFYYSSEIWGQTRQKSYTLQNDVIKTTISPTGITSLTSPADPYEANVISSVWERPDLKYKILDGDWLEMYRRARQVVLNPDSFVSIIDYQPGMPHYRIQTYS